MLGKNAANEIPVHWKTKGSSVLWQWILVQDPLTGEGHYRQVAVSLWPFGAISPKPLQLRGCWPGLTIVRTCKGFSRQTIQLNCLFKNVFKKSFGKKKS